MSEGSMEASSDKTGTERDVSAAAVATLDERTIRSNDKTFVLDGFRL
jgi:hypothetical protein